MPLLFDVTLGPRAAKWNEQKKKENKCKVIDIARNHRLIKIVKILSQQCRRQK